MGWALQTWLARPTAIASLGRLQKGLSAQYRPTARRAFAAYAAGGMIACSHKLRLRMPRLAATWDKMAMCVQVHAAKRPLAPDVDLMQLAKDLPGLSGAPWRSCWACSHLLACPPARHSCCELTAACEDPQAQLPASCCASLTSRCAGAELANVLNEGALVAVRRGADVISQADIYDGVDRILQVLALHQAPGTCRPRPSTVWLSKWSSPVWPCLSRCRRPLQRRAK